jgi:hypothetical protein
VGALAFGAQADGYVYTVDPLYRAGDFATGFTSRPTSVAFSPSGEAYIGDEAGQLYRFAPSGGDTSTAALLSSSLGRLSDLTFTANGRLYASRFYGPGGSLSPGDVVELDPSTGAEKRKVAEGLTGAEGLRQDPLSGDLFVARANEHNELWRIAGLESTTPAKTLYSNGTEGPYMAGFNWPFGVAFGQRGGLLLTDAGTDNYVFAIGGTNASQPAAISILTSISPANPVGIVTFPGFVLVNRSDGSIVRIDLTTPARAQTVILSGGSEGGMMAMGPEGCVYASEKEWVLKLTNADGSCPLVGHAPPRVQPTPPPGTETTHPGSPSPGPPAPALQALRISPARMRAAASGPSAILAARHRRHRSTGARVYYSLSKIATVRFQIERILSGRVDVHGRCRTTRLRGQHGAPCIQNLLLHGAMTINGAAGENSFRFMGRLAHKRLPRGNYRLIATPYLGHQTGVPVSASFSVVG